MPSDELDELARTIERAPLKLMVDNYRVQRLPRPLLETLGRDYSYYWGNLMLYSPIVEADAEQFELSVGGDFQVLGESGEVGEIDGRQLMAGQVLRLEAGVHQRSGSQRIRLRPVEPELEALRDPRFRDRRPLFPDVYDY